jgi:RNA polymerase sigma factor (sigma-70 family)
MRQSNSKRSSAARQRLDAAFAEYRPGLQRFLQGRSQVPQSAADLAQEVYLRILRFPPHVIIEQPQAYLYRIAANVVHDFNLRARSSLVTCDSRAVDEIAARCADASRDEVADPIADRQEIERLLSPLPPAWRAAIVLRHRDGFSYEEIAQQMKTTVEAVKKYLIRGQARLKTLRQGNIP